MVDDLNGLSACDSCSPGHEPNACNAEEYELGQWSGTATALAQKDPTLRCIIQFLHGSLLLVYLQDALDPLESL